jgi:hypothetical protein
MQGKTAALFVCPLSRAEPMYPPTIALGWKGPATAAGRSRGQLAPSLDASGQPLTFAQKTLCVDN